MYQTRANLAQHFILNKYIETNRFLMNEQILVKHLLCCCRGNRELLGDKLLMGDK